MAAPTNSVARALGFNEGLLEAAAAILSGKNNDGTAFSLPVTATVTVSAEVTASTSTLANVSDSASSVTLIALNTARLGFSIFNDSTADLYVKFGTTASATSFNVKILAGGYYESPASPIYTGRIDGIWTSAAGGAARVLQLSA